ncbi:YceI family protein [Novosphingobium album (ex Liu et al. 2023)]|uniref:YceI family protein n=1 Tax=Novosphingobium album (ex Liu et al. 2023) TaxID=3031130 RepID=A0ABT5WSP5_9SPHN|nr:YceI family protein [Novosphingobium album (ex Liu et al. 2023)]MDE8653062.1 YceI family protein [Novosphingobium album (ex Liu et al. 2023)]
MPGEEPSLSPRRAVVRWRRAVLPVLAGLAATSAGAGMPQAFQLDGPASRVEIKVGVLGLASRTARFGTISGRIALAPEPATATRLDVRLDARSLASDDKSMLARLKGADFLDVSRYPAIAFTGRAMRVTGPRTGDITGDLTIRGVTHAEVLHVTFDRDLSGIDGRAPLGLAGRMQIDRRAYGMTALPLIVGKTAAITITARLVPG